MYDLLIKIHKNNIVMLAICNDKGEFNSNN